MAGILIVDDDLDIVNALKIYLSSQEFTLYEATDGKQALDLVQKEPIDLVLMDIMMPNMDGITATAKMREVTNVPIILLTAKSEESDKILGLDIGADDYVTKPFHPSEVIARIRSQLRRYTRLGGQPVREDVIEIGGICLDDRSRTVTADGEEVNLTPVEYGILKLLMEHPGKVFTSQEIYRRVWKEEPIGSEGVVAVHIRHLREKIEIDPGSPRYIRVVWGQGYRMEEGRR
ncbi:MAG: response regulator transcription factor [Solobacterium sp.]|nr:response regulator transcription factor [Solobacterium sp.]